LLTGLVGPSDPQYMYVSIAEEALKDFRYDCVRLDFSLEDNLINAALRFQGAPADRLPFSFSTRRREFIRVTPERSNADFSQGIDLTLKLNGLTLADIVALNSLGR